LGLVFPEALKGDLGDVEGTALPVGTSCHAATGQHDHGGEGSGQDESAHPPKIQSLPSTAPRPRLWWCNADFDLTLAHGGGKMPAKILEAAGAMTWPLWPALAPDDFLIVPAAPPEGYREYLQGLGLRAPHFLTEGEAARRFSPPAHAPAPDAATSRPSEQRRIAEATPVVRFTPFGWNAAAVARNAGLPAPSAHP